MRWLLWLRDARVCAQTSSRKDRGPKRIDADDSNGGDGGGAGSAENDGEDPPEDLYVDDGNAGEAATGEDAEEAGIRAKPATLEEVGGADAGTNGNDNGNGNDNDNDNGGGGAKDANDAATEPVVLQHHVVDVTHDSLYYGWHFPKISLVSECVRLLVRLLVRSFRRFEECWLAGVPLLLLAYLLCRASVWVC